MDIGELYERVREWAENLGLEAEYRLMEAQEWVENLTFEAEYRLMKAEMGLAHVADRAGAVLQRLARGLEEATLWARERWQEAKETAVQLWRGVEERMGLREAVLAAGIAGAAVALSDHGEEAVRLAAQGVSAATRAVQEFVEGLPEAAQEFVEGLHEAARILASEFENTKAVLQGLRVLDISEVARAVREAVAEEVRHLGMTAEESFIERHEAKREVERLRQKPPSDPEPF